MRKFKSQTDEREHSTYDIRIIFLLLLLHKTFNMQDSSRSKHLEMIEYLDVQLFVNKQSIFDSRPKKLFSNCLVDVLLTSIVSIFKHSERCHSLLEGHLQYVMHTFELTSQKGSIFLKFSTQKKVFSLFSQWIV